MKPKICLHLIETSKQAYFSTIGASKFVKSAEFEVIMYSKKIKVLPFFFAVFFVFASFANSQTPVPTPPPIQDEAVEKVFTEEIKLNISALDQQGVFVDDVKKEDFVIVEDNRLNQASSLRRIPANILIVLDTGGEMRRAKSLDQTRETAVNLVNALKVEDSVAVMDYHDKVEFVTEWTTDKREVLNALDKKLNFGKRSVFLDALVEANRFMQRTQANNRHIVLITDGTDSFENQEKRKAAMNELLGTDINVHVISYTFLEKKELTPGKKVSLRAKEKVQNVPGEIAATMPNGVKDTINAPRIAVVNIDKEMIKAKKKRENEIADSQQFLLSLSKDTNGEFILPETLEEMKEKAQKVARIIDSSYVITYTPKRPLKDSPAGEVRNIVVSSKRPGLDIQARRKLIANQEETEQN